MLVTVTFAGSTGRAEDEDLGTSPDSLDSDVDATQDVVMASPSPIIPPTTDVVPETQLALQGVKGGKGVVDAGDESGPRPLGSLLTKNLFRRLASGETATENPTGPQPQGGSSTAAPGAATSSKSTNLDTASHGEKETVVPPVMKSSSGKHLCVLCV